MSLHLKRFVAAAFLLTSVPAVAQTTSECGPHNMKACDLAVEAAGPYKEKSIEALTHRAEAYVNLQKFEEAIADYDEAIQLDQKIAALYLLRGSAHVDLALKSNQQDALIEFHAREATQDLKKILAMMHYRPTSEFVRLAIASLKLVKPASHQTVGLHLSPK